MLHSPPAHLTALALVLVALVCATGPAAGVVHVENVVTKSFFDGIKSKSNGNSGCDGTAFYTREMFLNAVQTYYKGFAQTGNEDDGKREIAAFFAHVTHETGSMCHINEVGARDIIYCEASTQWPCAPGKKYYGRGPLQLSWNFNYGAAGRELKFDGLRNPDVLAQNSLLSFKASLWYWKTAVQQFVSQGFGATIRAINSKECGGGGVDKNHKMQDRVSLYLAYCKQFNVKPGTSLTC